MTLSIRYTVFSRMSLMKSPTNLAAQPPPPPESSSSSSKQAAGKWYFGGCASIIAACCTHPLDLLKVHLITQQRGKRGILSMTRHVIQHNGIIGLYSGLSASLLRQFTYSTTRFGIYESYKNYQMTCGVAEMPFYEKSIVSALAGLAGGVVGNPGDMINVRMQNDMKLPPEARRNYKHVADGLIRVCREEGPTKLMNGVTMCATRATIMTFGQLAFYDTFKEMLLHTGFFTDSPPTHLTACVGAACVACLLTQPFEVMKTRLMDAKPGVYTGLVSCGVHILATGPLGFFKGLLPAFMRLGPHMVITFGLLEQMKKHFGNVSSTSDRKS